MGRRTEWTAADCQNARTWLAGKGKDNHATVPDDSLADVVKDTLSRAEWSSLLNTLRQRRRTAALTSGIINANRQNATLAEFEQEINHLYDINRRLQYELKRERAKHKQTLDDLKRSILLKEHYQREAAVARHAANNGTGIEPDILRSMIRLCHPDRHDNSQVSNKVTQYLLSLRSKPKSPTTHNR